jgi:[ribosomal protein S5]-alanine N-acetyltransferase
MEINDSAISTEHLQLIVLSQDILRLSLLCDKQNVVNLLGIAVPDYWYKEEALIRLRLQEINEDPTYLPWSVRAIILKKEKEMIGYIGFHTKPDDPYLLNHNKHGAEIGFEVFPPYRRKGYAKEACKAIMKWAHDFSTVETFILSISPNNIASTQLANTLGFNKVGSQIDEIDGIEDIYTIKYSSIQNS